MRSKLQTTTVAAINHVLCISANNVHVYEEARCRNFGNRVRNWQRCHGHQLSETYSTHSHYNKTPSTTNTFLASDVIRYVITITCLCIFNRYQFRSGVPKRHFCRKKRKIERKIEVTIATIARLFTFRADYQPWQLRKFTNMTLE